jgi:hypothetical protein
MVPRRLSWLVVPAAVCVVLAAGCSGSSPPRHVPPPATATAAPATSAAAADTTSAAARKAYARAVTGPASGAWQQGEQLVGYDLKHGQFAQASVDAQHWATEAAAYKAILTGRPVPAGFAAVQRHLLAAVGLSSQAATQAQANPPSAAGTFPDWVTRIDREVRAATSAIPGTG